MFINVCETRLIQWGQLKEMTMKTISKFSMRSIPAATAVAAALVFGAQVHAQTNNTTTPPGSTKPNDQVQAAPNTNAAARAGAEAGNSSGNPVANSATQTGGTTKPKDNVMPAPTGGMAKDADARTAAKAEKREKRAAKKATNAAARDAAATSTGGAQAKSDGANSGGTK
jgi:hypothetical protein